MDVLSAAGPCAAAHRHGRINAAREPVFRGHLLNIEGASAKVPSRLIELDVLDPHQYGATQGDVCEAPPGRIAARGRPQRRPAVCDCSTAAVLGWKDRCSVRTADHELAQFPLQAASLMSPARPCIFLTVEDARRLHPLTRPQGSRTDPVRRLLAEELARAQLCDPAEMPARVVRLGSRVRYRDLVTGAEHLARLVLPADADPAQGRISVLGEPGAALIGVPQDQVFRWRDAAGRLQAVQVLEVLDDYVWR